MEKTTNNKNKIGLRNWIAFILIGLAGQLAWNVENMYLNKFIFSFGSANYTTMITITVAVSAVVACLTTIFMGALSDKLNKRKIFITVGYILWGLSTACFGFISLDNITYLFPTASAATICSILVIVFDGIMTFFGSTANDAAFNSYVTKNVNSKNRGKVEGVLSILPLLSMAIIFAGMDFLTSASDPHWDIFFFIIGGFAFLIGILSIFLLKKEPKEEKAKETYLNVLLDGFKIKTIKENKNLYIILIAYLLYGISTQIFFPYLIIYFQNSLEISGTNFIIALGSILAVGSILTVLFGILMDKIKNGKTIFAIPATLILSIGCFLVYLVKPGDLVFAIIAGIIMIFGYIYLGTVLNTIVRDYIPKEKEGIFMGVRMIFVVMIPMVSGPYIGQYITDNFATSTYTGDYGTTQNLPPSLIWLVSSLVVLSVLIPLIIYLIRYFKNNKYSIENNGITYNIDKEQKENLLDSNPNMSFKRNTFLSLNGYWDFEVSTSDELPLTYFKKIRVPYSPESPLSEINQFIKPNEYMFYKKTITIPKDFNKEHIFIHFLGVDQISELYLNKQLVCKNNCGFIPFSFDIAKYIDNKNQVEVILKVKDETDNNSLARGKQRLNRGGIWYTTTSGIYKSVYLDSAPNKYIISFDINTDLDNKKIYGIVKTNGIGTVKLNIENKTYDIKCNKEFEITLNDVHPWSLDDPYLYNIKLQYVHDVVYSYVAFRKIERKLDENNVPRIYLNNKKIYLKGVLNQGYYYKGNLTPASYDDFKNDILNMKELGFNAFRVHAKTEEDIFYYYADKYGFLIIQDIVNGGDKYKFKTISLPAVLPYRKKDDIDKKYKRFARENKEGRDEYLLLLTTTIKNLKLHPSVIGYTLFNEGWGQFDSTNIYKIAVSIDNTRLYDTNSGWYDNKNSDFLSKHIYFKKIKNYKDKNRCYFLSEFGGYSLYLNDHFYGNKVFGYKKYKNKESLTNAYSKLMDTVYKNSKKNLIGFIYTQLSDVEDEVNGIYTFDRKELKLNKEIVIKINNKFDEFIDK